MNKSAMFLTMVCILVLYNSAYAIVVVEPGYTIETYASYSDSGLTGPRAMAFDGDGNLYIAHQDDGTIWKVTSDGATSKFVTGLNLPRDIDWGGGTDYGNSLYVADNSGVLKIDLDGTTSRFASVSGTPVAIGIDKGGNYAGELYVGTGGDDYTYSVNTGGGVSLFSNFPYDTSGGSPLSIAFDTTASYDGLMYVGTQFGSGDADVSGLFAMDTDGSVTRFTEDLVLIKHVALDPMDIFDGEMFAIGSPEFGSPADIWRVDSDGAATEFALGYSNALAFGLDGSMYLAEYSTANEMLTISRVTPEPATVLLLGLGSIMLRKKRKA